jgi:hemoglobin-like flavoprotein
MTPSDITVIERSFAAAKPKADFLVKDFYRTLFNRNPELRALFAADMTQQHQKLIAVLATAIGSLRQIDKLVPVLRDLGARHVAYGVEAEHYDLVGQALLSALERTLGADWTSEAQTAWATLYCVVSETMQSGASALQGGEAA